LLQSRDGRSAKQAVYFRDRRGEPHGREELARLTQRLLGLGRLPRTARQRPWPSRAYARSGTFPNSHYDVVVNTDRLKSTDAAELVARAASLERRTGA